MEKGIEIFFCYARKDQALLNDLKTHLTLITRSGLINMWHDANISPGAEWEKEIDKHLNTAQIILLLISPDFMDSDYCYGIEMKRAMERYEQGKSRVIPIILRPVYWQKAPFGKLQALPTDAKAVISWQHQDEAFFDVAMGILKAVEEILQQHLRSKDNVSPKLKALTRAYEQVRVGKITNPDIIRSIASQFETLVSDPKVEIDVARAAQVLRERAEVYEKQYML